MDYGGLVMGDLSTHFSASEFACPHCGVVKVVTPLVDALEKARNLYYPKGLRIISGYRCVMHNRAVKGAPSSRHLRGDAADIVPVMTVPQAEALGFRGIGYVEATGKVAHVDMRSRRAFWSYT
jgi:uncharacterized protein YcbK (DUF882 family)